MNQSVLRPAAPPPEDDNPFAVRSDGSAWPDHNGRGFSEAERDRAADEKAKRDSSKSGKKKIKQSDLESLTRNLLRKQGYVYGRTETVGYTGLKNDLFGFLDGIAIGENEILFVQTTSRSNRAAHIKKMATGFFKIGNGHETPCFDASSRMAKNPNCKLVIILWDQPNGAGAAWRHEMEEVTLEMLIEYRERSRNLRGVA